MSAVAEIAWNISCTLDCERWLTDLPGAEAICRRAAAAAFGAVQAEHGAADQTADQTADPGANRKAIGNGEMGVVLADDDLVRELNRRYRGIDRATNVLAFPMSEATSGPGTARGDGLFGPPGLLGDVVVALESAAREAAEQDKRLRDHLSHLVVHGTLHLLGYDHEMEAQASRMERLETEALAGLGVADPYADESAPETAEPAGVKP